ncbi:MAG: molybdopterin molybdotransferase MoeA, partial [Thiotrichaceae bacterium]|nr:molybdopterin molybdotransferase MoeA [Thiotrichaceae bacterium]
MSVTEALKNIANVLSAVKGEETANLHTALGRILTENCIAPFNLPAFANSSMDGYAFNSADIQQSSFELIQSGTSWAGRPFDGSVFSGQCVRIFTGAVMPKGCDSVIMQEQVETNDNIIHFRDNTQAQQNVRYIGEDVKQQDCLLSAPKQLTAIDLGLLASSGLYEFQVKRKIRVAFFSTGDELCAIGTPLEEGKIYDSNRYLLTALLNDPCYEVTDLGVMADNKNQIRQ